MEIGFLSLKYFKFLVENIKNQMDLNREAEDKLEGVFEDFCGFIKTPLVDRCIDFLEEVMKDEFHDISYFMFDCGFGLDDSMYKNGESPITEKNGVPIPFKTIEDLYNKLTKIN